MKKLLFLLQIILKCSLIFFLAFIWLKYFINALWISIVSAVGITILIEIVSFILSKKRKNAKDLKLKEKEDAENIFLSLLTQTDYLSFFESLAKTRHKNVVKKKEYICIKNVEEDKKTILFPFIKMKLLGLDDISIIAKICNKEKANKAVIICYDYDKNCISFAKNFEFDTILLDRFETYISLYKEYDYYPQITNKYKKEAKLTFKDLIAYSFNKSKTRGYILSALILFLTSFFVNVNIYYCIACSILLLFALISYINPKFNKLKQNNLI